MLLVVFPLALVLVAVEVRVDAVALGLLVLPHALVDVALVVNEATVAVLLAVFPEALVATAVGPDLNASAGWDVQLDVPLAFVLIAIADVDHLLQH